MIKISIESDRDEPEDAYVLTRVAGKAFSINLYCEEDGGFDCDCCKVYHCKIGGKLNYYRIFQHSNPSGVIFKICSECHTKLGRAVDEKSLNRLICLLKMKGKHGR